MRNRRRAMAFCLMPLNAFSRQHTCRSHTHTKCETTTAPEQIGASHMELATPGNDKFIFVPRKTRVFFRRRREWRQFVPTTVIYSRTNSLIFLHAFSELKLNFPPRLFCFIRSSFFLAGFFSLFPFLGSLLRAAVIFSSIACMLQSCYVSPVSM